MPYQVTGALAVVTIAGQRRYLYEGAVLPEDIEQEEIDRLVDARLVSEVDDSGNVVREGDEPGDSTDQPEPSPALANPADVLSQPAEVTGEPVPERPSLVASKEVWVDYAVTRGMSRARAESMSKRELIDAYPAG
jgi:hypothetical protein